MKEHHSRPEPRTSPPTEGTFRVYAYADPSGASDGQIPCPGPTAEAAWRNVEPYVRHGVEGFVEDMDEDDEPFDVEEDIAKTVRLYTVLTTIDAPDELSAFRWWRSAGQAVESSDYWFETWRKSFPHEGGDDPIAIFIANEREKRHS